MSSVPGNILSASVLGDRYEVLSPLGAGASADVFRVRDLRTGAIRAAKVLKTEYAANAEILARFEDEFRILRTLHHPHLPEVFDYGWTEGGGRFLVMELVDGEPLDRYFRAHPEDIWVILYELCETLVFVHARNLLHQDIKPSNILVTRAAGAQGDRPLIKLIDFGLTHRRGVGAAVRLVGTAEYIAPEVVRGERTLTRAVDYYSLGATLFELLSGAPPFAGSENEVLRAHLEREPVIENEELEWAELYPHVRALLTKDAQARLAAFEEFRRGVVARVTGGIDDLDRSYALARIDSLGMIGKEDAWEQLSRWLDASVAGGASAEAHTFSISGSEGVGKRFLTGSLRAEAALHGVRTLAPAEVGLSRRDVAATRQPALMWSRLLEACEKEPVVLVVERPLLLPDEERSFVRLAGTQWELFRSRGRVLPLFFLVALDSTTEDSNTLDYLPSDGAINLDLAALGKDDRAQIVDKFRGSMFDPNDARALTTYLSRFDDAGSAIQGLQRAVLRGGLTFLGQRWKVQPGLLTDVIKSEQSGAFSHDLVASLSAVERRVAGLAAAHPDPVPLSWIAEFLTPESSSLSTILAGTLRRLLAVSADACSPVTTSLRIALRAGCDPAEMRRAHEFLAERLIGLERSVASDRSLAYHYEQLGHVRDAARVHLGLLRAYWSVRPRERPYELIEGVCRGGLELLEAHGATVSASTRRHLFCFYIKEWIKAFWARNLFTHAKPVIDEWTKRLGEKMPASVAPRYVRSVLELEGPQNALAAIDKIGRAIPRHGEQYGARMELERSLCFHHLGQYRKALESLSVVETPLLSSADKYRHVIYRAMHITELGEDRKARELMAELEHGAEQDKCIDEVLLMRAIIARSLLGAGQTRDSLVAAARGLRLAHTAGLHYRANFMYRMASTAYEELGDVARTRRCQERAIQLADALGLRDMAGIGWSRLATSERKAGRYGNALQYFDRAIAVLGESGPAWSRTQAHVGLYGLLVLTQHDRRSAKAAELVNRLKGSREHNTLGFYYYWRGLDLEFRGNTAAALRSYHKSNQHFASVGQRSNIAWALSRQVRVHLHKREFKVTSDLLLQLESMSSGSREAEFELSIVKLKASYLAREPSRIVLEFAKECEEGLRRDQNAYLRIEALQAVFRVYARRSMAEQARSSLDRYREALLEISSNVDRSQAARIAEISGAVEMAGELSALDRITRSGRGPAIAGP